MVVSCADFPIFVWSEVAQSSLRGISTLTYLGFVSSLIFFFSSRRRHTRCLSDWSSDVCSSDLKDALHAYEQALALEERPDAAVAAGDLYRRAGLLQEAAARFARAYAAGGGAEALWLNAQALFQAGEERAADEALHLWATQVPGGLDRLSQARAELRAGKRDDGGKRED